MSALKTDQSQRNTRTSEQNQNNQSLETSTPQKNTISFQTIIRPSTSKIDEINGIDMAFIYKKRGHSTETDILRTEKNLSFIATANKTSRQRKRQGKNVGISYLPSQQGRKQVERRNVLIYNRFFCELIGTTPLQAFQQNNNQSWIQNNSDRGSRTSRVKQDRCPTTVLLNFCRHESINLIWLKQMAKLHKQNSR